MAKALRSDELPQREQRALRRCLDTQPAWAPHAAGPAQLLGPLGGGRSNCSLLLQTVNDDGTAARWVLRIGAAPPHPGVCRKRELAAHRAAAAAGIAPPVAWADTDTGLLLTPFIEAARTPPGRHGPGVQESGAVAELLRKIHQLAVTLDPDPLADRVAALAERGLTLLGHRAGWPRARRAQLDGALKDALQVLENGPGGAQVPCHGDLLNANRLRAIGGGWLAIDWEYAAPRSALYDVAVTASELTDSDAFAFLDLYLQRAATPEEATAFGACRLVYACLACFWYLAFAVHDAAASRAEEHLRGQLAAVAGAAR